MNKDFEKAYDQATKSILENNCNILIIGKTGVGKSTLVNAIFGEGLAEAGGGKPVTQHIDKCTKPGSNFTIYDTPGLELSNLDKVKTKVFRWIKQKKKGRWQEHIHLVWYCINEMSDRIDSKEKEWVNELIAKDLPVIVVLTKGTEKELDKGLSNELKEWGEDLKLKKLKKLKESSKPELSISRVKTEPKQIVQDFKVKVHSPGLEELVKTTTQNLPEIARTEFMRAVSDIDYKKKAATRRLILYAASAFTIPTLLPTLFPTLFPFLVLAKKVSSTTVQTTMLVHLFTVFELPLDSKIIYELFSLGISLNLIDLSVDFSVENIVRLITCQLSQTSLEELIAGGAASLSTLVTGLAYIDVLVAYKEAQLAGKEISVTELAEMLKKKIQEYTQPGWEILKQILDDGGGNSVWQTS